MSFDLPTTLTPSKISSFVNCPLAFRYSYLERLPEPSTIHQVRGTLLHRALQLLYSGREAPERDAAAAAAALEVAWDELIASEEFASVGLDAAETDKLRRDATVLLERYFAIEDPTDVHAVGLEIDLRCNIEGVELRGIIDRLDHLDGDELAVVDYKTGRSPRPEQSRARLSGVQFYAFMCEQVFGRRPREIRLVYLRDRVVVVESPTEQSMRGQRQRMLAVWQAISRACEQGDFRPNPSRLCGSCNFRDRCPAVGGATEIARASHEVRVVFDDLAAKFDDRVETQFKRLRGNAAADRVFYSATALGDFGLAWVVFALLRALRGGRQNERAAVRAIVATGIESVLVNIALKSLIRRHRPTSTLEHPHRIRQPLSSSFPSGHATAAFCGATLLADGDPAAPIYFAAAATIAASRVHTGMHHATDVAGGVLVGLALGQVGKRLFPLRRRAR